MTSESEEVTVEDSDESLLDFKEIDDLEFDIPEVAPPTLEKVLWDLESEEGSDTASLHSCHSMTMRFRSLMSHCILQGVSTQIASATNRAKAGLPTVICNSLKFVAVGTSHGYVMTFDAHQNLCWYHCDVTCADQGAVSALAFNLESTRLLVGYERGLVTMLDGKNGDSLRKMAEAHAPQTAVLHLRFTYLSNLALCGDSSGCVFTLGFNKRLGVRTWDSKCLFSGARGEVCVFEPLVQGYDVTFLSKHVIVAMATLSKIIVISVKPRLKVHFNQQLPKISVALPLLSWQLISIGKTFQPVLAWARGNYLHYSRLITNFSASNSNNQIRVMPLRKVELSYSVTALHWLGTRHVALLDSNENLHLMGVRSQRELEVLELGGAGLVYGSAHFKGLAVGGGVSEAFALAGERACYNSLSSRATQLLVLGTKAVHMVRLRTWTERIAFLSEQGRWSEALNLASDEGLSKETFTVDLLTKYLDNLHQCNRVDKDSLTAAVACCVKLNKMDILCNELLDAVRTDHSKLDWYFSLLADHICQGVLRHLSPSVCQFLVDYLEKKDPQLLESVLLSLDLDLHQVLKVCKRLKLYNAWIRVTTGTLGDYTAPLVEFLGELTPNNNRLGNTLLVYVSSCLAGLGYPTGNIDPGDVTRVKCDVLRCLETVHSVNGTAEEKSYPYLRALLRYNTRECLNVIELAFTEAEFTGEMGILQRERLIHILTDIVQPPEFKDNQIVHLACFVSRLIVTCNLSTLDLSNLTINQLTAFKSDSLSARDRADREYALLQLLQSNKVPYNALVILERALQGRLYRAAQFIHEVTGNYAGIMECYLQDPERHGELFEYIRTYAREPLRNISEQLQKHFSELIRISCEETTRVVLEHFPELVEPLAGQLRVSAEKFRFLHQLVHEGFKLLSPLSEEYLELLCVEMPEGVCAFLASCHCRTDEALEIVKKNQVHEATALLLEQSGEWSEALDLLLRNNLVDEAVALCIRGAEHLDADGAQRLWLTLLRGKRNTSKTSLRHLLHAAAPHVPPDQLLELLTNVPYGEVKSLVRGVLADYRNDLDILNSSFKVLDTDLHHSLAKTLHTQNTGKSIRKLTCERCGKSLLAAAAQSGPAIVWACAHAFHERCCAPSMRECPTCRTGPVREFLLPRRDAKPKYQERSSLRPDLEGHF